MDSYSELQDFLCHWYNTTADDLAWDGALPAQLHPEVRDFYTLFGELTRPDGRFAMPRLPPPLGAQDTITPVTELKVTNSGEICLLTENQGVWHAGQNGGSDRLWSTFNPITQDYGHGPNPPLYNAGISFKDVLITSALFETIMSAADAGPAFSDEEWAQAEQQLHQSGTVSMRRYIYGQDPVFQIGWTADVMGFNFDEGPRFATIVRRTDKAQR